MHFLWRHLVPCQDYSNLPWRADGWWRDRWAGAEWIATRSILAEIQCALGFRNSRCFLSKDIREATQKASCFPSFGIDDLPQPKPVLTLLSETLPERAEPRAGSVKGFAPSRSANRSIEPLFDKTIILVRLYLSPYSQDFYQKFEAFSCLCFLLCIFDYFHMCFPTFLETILLNLLEKTDDNGEKSVGRSHLGGRVFSSGFDFGNDSSRSFHQRCNMQNFRFVYFFTFFMFPFLRPLFD